MNSIDQLQNNIKRGIFNHQNYKIIFLNSSILKNCLKNLPNNKTWHMTFQEDWFLCKGDSIGGAGLTICFTIRN